MKYTYYGQSCFLLETSSAKLLFDPFISGNPLAKDIDVTQIEADYILVSHGHGDHVADLVAIAQRTNAKVICMPEIAGWLQKQGVTNIHDMNIGKFKFDFGTVRMVAATHSSSLPDGSYGGNPAGYVLDVDGRQIYFAGDTGLTIDMKLLAELYQLEYAILPIGGNYTMDADDAVIAAEYVNCQKVIGVHYDSFPVIAIDKYTATEIFKRAQKQLLLPEIGETIVLS
ncbi:metal-dependent hydrolase [Pedobacter sp. SL55]|uniref:metal-dependent hydrolase n=1 Tax=Pedobacter sp. SL55 TaxID=2995161 RepID=UPI00226F51EC|nr:metal-dependent hydrolase [Pedobacter sp. SL55]WAC41704.1 metal-dependent hydrolase [Pedobacter sp. SL55]